MEPDRLAVGRQPPGRALLGVVLAALLAPGVAFGQERAPASFAPAPLLIQAKSRRYWVTSPPAVTFTRDVAPILQANCQECHRPGGIGPFSLLTYANAKAWAAAIKAYTGRRVMPPWKAATGYGEFQGERRLTDAQIQTIAAWVDADAPEGDVKEMPAPRQFRDGWQLGTPDMALDADEPFRLPANSGDVYRIFVLPFHPDKDVWVTAMEVLPGNRAVVHHVNIYLDPKGVSPMLDRAAPGPGFPTTGGGAGFDGAILMDVWQPGASSRFLPEGTAWRIPAHAYVALEVHYSPTAQSVQDLTRVGLHFARGPIDKRVRTADVGNIQFRVPAGPRAYHVPAGGQLPVDLTVLSVLPHMHLIAREMKATASMPNGLAKPLIWIQDWDIHWQLSYVYKEPLKLPKGSRMDLQAVYDNSADNPNNPNYPPRPISFGPSALDEMCYLYFRYTVDEEHLLQGHPVDADGIEGTDIR